MKSLTTLWKEAQVWFAVNCAHDLTPSVDKRMEQDGWQFGYDPKPSRWVKPVIITPPPGSDFQDALKQYRIARRTAAREVYGLK